MILQLQSTCLWTRVGFWTTEIQNTHGRRSFISRKSGLRAVVMWSCEPFRFQSFAPVSEMNNRTLSPLPGHPLICLHFYSSHQFPEATLTSSKVMAEHLCFKTFRMSTRCLYEKKISHPLIYSATQISLRGSGRVHVGNCVKRFDFERRFLHNYKILVTVIRAPYFLSAYKAKTVISHALHFPYT